MSKRIGVVVTGSRDGATPASYERLYTRLAELCIECGDPARLVVISGGATGVDTMAATYATQMGAQSVVMPVTEEMWNDMGRRAGPTRNAFMAHVANYLYLCGYEVLCIALPGGKGTNSMKNQARMQGIKIEEIP